MVKPQYGKKALLSAVLAICVLASTLNAGCWRDTDPSLLVFAAASLAEPLEQIREQYQSESMVEVDISYGGSQALAQQIANGAPADILISAGNLPLAFLNERDWIEHISSISLANEIVIATDLDIHLASIHDLTDSKFRRIALPNPSLAPSGMYIKSALEQAGIWEELSLKVIMGANAAATKAILDTGNVDAALLYFTDVSNDKDVKMHRLFPEENYPPINYPVGFIKGSNHFELAQHFVAYVGSPKSLEAFRVAGFSVK